MGRPKGSKNKKKTNPVDLENLGILKGKFKEGDDLLEVDKTELLGISLLTVGELSATFASDYLIEGMINIHSSLNSMSSMDRLEAVTLTKSLMKLLKTIRTSVWGRKSNAQASRIDNFYSAHSADLKPTDVYLRKLEKEAKDEQIADDSRNLNIFIDLLRDLYRSEFYYQLKEVGLCLFKTVEIAMLNQKRRNSNTDSMFPVILRRLADYKNNFCESGAFDVERITSVLRVLDSVAAREVSSRLNLVPIRDTDILKFYCQDRDLFFEVREKDIDRRCSVEKEEGLIDGSKFDFKYHSLMRDTRAKGLDDDDIAFIDEEWNNEPLRLTSKAKWKATKDRIYYENKQLFDDYAKNRTKVEQRDRKLLGDTIYLLESGDMTNSLELIEL